MTLSDSITRHVTEYLRAALAETGGNVQEAARIAGIHRATFYRFCQRCGVEPDEARAAPPSPRATSRMFKGWRVSRPTA